VLVAVLAVLCSANVSLHTYCRVLGKSELYRGEVSVLCKKLCKNNKLPLALGNSTAGGSTGQGGRGGLGAVLLATLAFC
jgi:hypothetical protein